MQQNAVLWEHLEALGSFLHVQINVPAVQSS